MVGNRFKTGLEVDPGAEFQDGASDGSFGGKPWCLGLSLGSPGRWGRRDRQTWELRPGSLRCKSGIVQLSLTSPAPLLARDLEAVFSEVFRRKGMEAF